jgi:hypothetical protein
MDKFIMLTGIIGLLFLLIALLMIISIFENLIKRKIKVRAFPRNFIIFIIIVLLGSSFIYLSLFLKTFSIYTKEEQVGTIYATSNNKSIDISFYNEKEKKNYEFSIEGEQWMIEGYFMRWSLPLRLFGTPSYYKITRFSGRSNNPDSIKTSYYQIHTEQTIWKYFLKHGEKIPFVDAAYGIATFQYPKNDTFYLYINDTGFILRNR